MSEKTGKGIQELELGHWESNQKITVGNDQPIKRVHEGYAVENSARPFIQSWYERRND